jgi:hypothetical protein
MRKFNPDKTNRYVNFIRVKEIEILFYPDETLASKAAFCDPGTLDKTKKRILLSG